MRTYFRTTILLLSLAVCALADEPPNAPEANRKTIAGLIQAKLSRELSGKKFKSDQVEEKIKIGIIETEARAQAVAEFINPVKELTVDVPQMINTGSEGIQMTVKVKAPAKVHAEGGAGPIKLGADAKGKVELEIHADVKWALTLDGKVKIDINIRQWDGNLADIDVGDGDVNQVLGPILQQVCKNTIQDNREKLQEKANQALKKASEEGRLQFKF